ncbi:mRNA splicing factor [Phytophthora cinnamomi]|uniref:mRNA splicing factor n=1 Tax=Phytophthora cinnamomi TaxID=4785 RepID=UPI00355A9126|nr:mRNA splicing factor [Phytophthora cinnamomi]
MDLYADLPLAKGAKASSALDADGKPKAALSSTSSVWASAPLMVPQAAKNKSNNRPTVATSSTSMLPSALAAGRGKSPTRTGISLAFKPASVARRPTAASQVFQKKLDEGNVVARPAGRGLGYVAATEVKVTSVHQQEKQQVKEETEVDVDVGPAAGGHFFQATYRDEYHPARPNSYEVYCKERQERKKMEKVKKELSRRQREQEREGKLEREQLAKDLAEGRAPAMKLPAPAGRGRGMTMPAWMRKKIEENAAASQPESERDVDRAHGVEMNSTPAEGQFEDAAEPRGLGFSTREMDEPNPRTRQDAFNGNRYTSSDRGSSDRHRSQSPMLDEFGREIRQEPKRRYDDRHDDQQDSRRSSLVGHNGQSYRRGSTETHGSGEKRRRTSGWDSRSSSSSSRVSTSRVVLLQNMVGPGEVDDELQDEVKGECSDTYGPVTKCTIYEVTGRVPPEEAVRIFVQFKNAEDATKALTGLNGRFFGGRKVKAVYYDESKFERMDLISQ